MSKINIFDLKDIIDDMKEFPSFIDYDVVDNLVFVNLNPSCGFKIIDVNALSYILHTKYKIKPFLISGKCHIILCFDLAED